MRHRAAARKARNCAARIRFPVGGAQAGKGRHQHDSAGVGNALRQGFDLAALFERTQAVAHPLHHRTGHEHAARSEEHTSELQSLMRISYAVFCLKKKKKITTGNNITNLKIKQDSNNKIASNKS